MLAFVRKHTLPVVACILAVISAFFVTPSAAYLDYFDWRTLSSLLCILLTVNALVGTGIFDKIAASIVSRFKTERACVIALVTITLVGAMFFTNDMALLTFLPLSYLVFKSVDGRPTTLAWCFLLQNAAAILGGMILPFGNPHNLYLYALFEIPTSTFILTMMPTFLTACVLIYGCCFFVKPTPLSNPASFDEKKNNNCDGPSEPLKLVIYGLLFVLTLASVLRFAPYYVALIIVVVVMLVCDRKLFARVDYGLLVTFAAFFVFAGNMTAIPEVVSFLEFLLGKSVLLCSVLASQVISNLPTTLILAPFTTEWAPLLVGTDIAGMGTPIASLASLITITAFLQYRPDGSGMFMKRFLIVGFGFLAVMVVVAALTL